jgi:c-di-GMP-binding flagellar brake protein YcgR
MSSTKESPAIAVGHDWSDADRRQYERFVVDFFCRVVEVESEAVLGDVVDVSLGGIQLMSKVPVPIGKQYGLRMEVSLESGRRERVALEARSVWTQRDASGDHYTTGFEFLGLSSTARRSVQAIIDELGG